MKIAVDVDALRQVLNALNGPAHYIRELQVTRNLDELMGTTKNPINKLIADYNSSTTAPLESVSDDAAQKAAEGISPWLSAAASDPKVCPEFKDAIDVWFAASRPAPVMDNAEIMDAYQAMQEELKWVRDVIAEHLGYDGPLAPATCPLVEVLTKAEENEKALEVKERQVKVAREYAEKKSLEAATYLPKILQLTALLKRARVDVNAAFQMNADLERFHPLPEDDQVAVTAAADKYQEFLDEIDAALWVPPENQNETS